VNNALGEVTYQPSSRGGARQTYRCAPANGMLATSATNHHGERRMRKVISGAILFVALIAAGAGPAHGAVRGAQDGADAGNRAAGPAGAVVGGAVGAVTGTVGGILGVQPTNPPAPGAGTSAGPGGTPAAPTNPTGKK